MPVTQELKQLGLTNTWWGLILPYTALGIPFATVILVNVMEDLPAEVSEVIAMDAPRQGEPTVEEKNFFANLKERFKKPTPGAVPGGGTGPAR